MKTSNLTLFKRLRLAAHRHRRLAYMFPAVLLTAVTATLLFPQTAYAEQPGFTLLDLPASLKNFICYLLLEGASGFFDLYDSLISNIGNDMLSLPFNSMLGGGTYNLAQTIHQTVIIPIGESILALFMLVQLVKISQRIDATSTLPAVKDIVFLSVAYVLIHWLITSSFDIMQDIYKIVANDIIPQMGTAGAGSSVFGPNADLTTAKITNEIWDKLGIAECFLTFLVSFLSLIGGLLAYIVAFIVSYARAWQIYVLAVFAPIPLALLGFEETRQSGISFLKNFVAVCLAGAVMMFLLVIYPSILTGMTINTFPEGADGAIPILFMVASPGSAFTIGLSIEGVLAALEFLGVTILLIFGLIKSGAWAKEILGS